MADRAAAFLKAAENSAHVTVLQMMVDRGAWREYGSHELAAGLGRHQAAYPVLRRLEAEGLVESRWDYEPKRWREDTGRVRYYKLTATATKLLEPADAGSRPERRTRRARLASTAISVISSVQREPGLQGFRLLRAASQWYPEVERADFLDETSDHLKGHLAGGRKRSAYLVGLSEWFSAARSYALAYIRSSGGDRLGTHLIEILILSLLGAFSGGVIGWINGWLALGLVVGLVTGAVVGALGGPSVGLTPWDKAVNLLALTFFAMLFGALAGGLSVQVFGWTTELRAVPEETIRRTMFWVLAAGSPALAVVGVLLWNAGRIASPFVAWLRRRLA